MFYCTVTDAPLCDSPYRCCGSQSLRLQLFRFTSIKALRTCAAHASSKPPGGHNSALLYAPSSAVVSIAHPPQILGTPSCIQRSSRAFYVPLYISPLPPLYYSLFPLAFEQTHPAAPPRLRLLPLSLPLLLGHPRPPNRPLNPKRELSPVGNPSPSPTRLLRWLKRYWKRRPP